jgi:hypothetical protein
MSEAEWDESIDIAPKLGAHRRRPHGRQSATALHLPVVIKGQLRGHLVAYVTASPLEGEAYMKAGRPEAIVFSATGEALTQDAQRSGSRKSPKSLPRW